MQVLVILPLLMAQEQIVKFNKTLSAVLALPTVRDKKLDQDWVSEVWKT